jgi:hypothetical protein
LRGTTFAEPAFAATFPVPGVFIGHVASPLGGGHRQRSTHCCRGRQRAELDDLEGVDVGGRGDRRPCSELTQPRVNTETGFANLGGVIWVGADADADAVVGARSFAAATQPRAVARPRGVYDEDHRL